MLSKTMIGVVLSSCLLVSIPLNEYGFAQAPPEDIGSDRAPTEDGEENGAPPEDNGQPEPPGAPPSNLATPIPAELLGSPCPSNISNATLNDNISTVENVSNTSGFGSNIYDPRFTLTRVLIVQDLSSLSPSEIKDYDLTPLSGDEVQSVLCMLTPGNLTKVLMNIPSEGLLDIKGKLNPLTLKIILNRIPEDSRTQVVNRTIN